MKARRKTTWIVATFAVGILCCNSTPSIAQDFIIDWNVGGPAPWNVDENWLDEFGDAFVPEAGLFDEAARFANGGTAVVAESVPNVSALTMANGTVDIQQGGSLEVVGPTTMQGAGNLILSGNASFSTEGFEGGGHIDLIGERCEV